MPLLPSHTLLQAYVLTLLGCSVLLVYSPLTLLNASPLWLLGESMHVRRATFVPSLPDLSGTPSTSSPGVTLQGKRSVVASVLGSSTSSSLTVEVREVLALLGLVVFLGAVTLGVLVTPLRYSKGGVLALAHKSVAPKRIGGGNSSYAEAEVDVVAASEFAGKIHTLATAQTLVLVMAALRVVGEGALVAWVYLRYADRRARLGEQLVFGAQVDAGWFGLLANRVVFAGAMSDMLFWGYTWTVVREEARDIAEVLAQRGQALEELMRE